MEIASKYKPAEQQACADKFTKRISHLVRKSIKDLNMISHGDREMVCMSGGKGNYGLLETLTELQKEAPIKFQHVAVNLLNLFFSISLKTMPPKLFSDDKRHIYIRPLSYVQDKDLYALADYKKFPMIPCNLCSSQKSLQRYKVKKLIAEREKSDPNRIKSMFHALSNVIPSHLLDTKMFDFKHE